MLEKPRYIDMDKCIACGTCAEKCPRKVVNEFNMGLDKRKAAYVKYSQTVPLKYAIDAANCIFFKKGKCKACEKFCPTKAVNFAQEAKTHVINVGSIILAPGFESFDPTPYENYSYKDSPNCITSMEFERVLSASGPYAGHLVRPGDKKEPRRIAFIQCVGSRDTHHSNNGYCSSVCCMYAIKEALVAMEHSKEPLETSIFYMDMRTYGKDFEKYYNQAQEKGVRFIRARVYNISPADETGDLIVRYATQQGDINEDVFDLVVLSTGLVVPQSVRDLASVIGIELNRYKFAKTSSFSPVSTSVPGIYACGAFQDPKDIPYSVMEASAASSAATSKLAGVKGTLVNEKTFPEERDISGEPIRIGVFVCNCGVNIGGVVNVPEVAEYAKRLPNVVYVQENLFSCSQDAQDKLREVIIENNLNRVVVAACSPRTHEPLFQETLKSCGINKYLFEMTNIRDQNSWVHQNEPEAATEKAKDLVRMAVAKASLLFPLKEVKLGITPAALVVGGGIAGMVAALSLASQGYRCYIVEKSDKLGGQANNIRWTWKDEDVPGYIQRLVHEVNRNERITVYLKSKIVNVEGFVGNFKSTISTNGGDQTEEIEHGVAIISTGARPFIPDEYLYGKNPKVMLWHDVDRLIEENDELIAKGRCAVFIQCVGSREPERPYCSKICCTHSLKCAINIKEINPEMEVYILNRDIRTYGIREDIYKVAREKGVIFVRYTEDEKPKVEYKNGNLRVTVRDHVLGLPITLEPDFISLATAIIPEEQGELATLFKVPLNEDGFFLEAHAKLRPVDFATDGVFVCGMAHYPKPIDESITQAMAAASRAATVLSQKKIEISGIVSVIDPETCVGCMGCLEVCPYGAINYVEDRKICQVNEALCKGCGACAATCPSGSPQLMGFTEEQLFAMIEGALGEI